jgi:hypothetical protein
MSTPATETKKWLDCSKIAEQKKCRKCFFRLVAASFYFLALIVAWYFGKRSVVHDTYDTKAFLTMLPFVVALAAYLANVAREIIKKLGTKDSNGKNANTPADILKMRCNIAWMTTAEIQLVVLGLLILVRIIAGPDPFIPTPFIHEPILIENIIWIYLSLILVLLSVLHLRVWKNERPLDIHRD